MPFGIAGSRTLKWSLCYRTDQSLNRSLLRSASAAYWRLKSVGFAFLQRSIQIVRTDPSIFSETGHSSSCWTSSITEKCCAQSIVSQSQPRSSHPRICQNRAFVWFHTSSPVERALDNCSLCLARDAIVSETQATEHNRSIVGARNALYA